MTCNSCVFFTIAGFGNGHGICRRFPPQVLSRDGKPIAWFPHVRADEDWCGEFKRVPETPK